MSNLQVFKNEQFGEMRTVTINDKIYFVGLDVAKALGYAIPSKAINTHCKGVSKTEVPTNGGTQEMLIISEGDIYRLITHSKLDGSEKFESWVFDEVLPTIRKHGAYMTDEVIEKALTSPDFLIKLATQLKEAKAELTEKNNFINQIAVSENSLLVREVAKIVSKNNIVIGEKRLWDKLREWGLIFKNSTEAKQQYIDRNYFEVTEGSRECGGKTFTYHTTRVTGKGQKYIIERLIKEKAS